eukprot:GFUD01045412.1.p1 GENE.GFUD01045412.1~~GFUD01045412.1.p1  ORF type:complete len:414 (-),score=134.99 GFUD01045412.1:136-1377(-)
MVRVVSALLVSILSLALGQEVYHSSLSTAVAQFTQSIYQHLADTSQEENFVFSPLSLHSALTLLYLATRDNSTTRDQLGAAMGIINSQDLVKTAYQKLIQEYRNQQSFLYGNHIWIGNELEVDEEYKTVVKSHFDSEISNLDFGKVNAVNEVNDWIKKTTNNKIENLVDTFSADTQMFLANALYFKENWLIPFKDQTVDGKLIERDFHTDTGKIKVPMVWQESDQFGFGQIRTSSGVLEVVTIPYGNENFEMQFILTEGNKHLSIIENMMKFDQERDKVEKFNLFEQPKNVSDDQPEEIHLMFPNFQVKSKFNAAEALKTLGAREVFTSGAELDKITAGGPIGVGNILHEAVVEVTKDGTEGAAATGIELTLYSAGFVKNIMLDRPFIFIVQDKVNNIPVLVGRIKNPSIKLP